MGSFYNVLIIRTISGESILFPPSKCPICNTQLKWWQNIPVISYLILKGKCYKCCNRIDIIYPTIEILSACIYGVLFIKFGLSIKFLFSLIVLSLFLVLAGMDIKAKMISVKYSIILPGVQKKSPINFPFVLPAALLLVIYVFFIIGYISEISANNRLNKYYEDALAKVYTNLGVASSKDPYGSLIQQSKSVSGGSSSQRILSILNDLNNAAVNGVVFEGINIRDNDIRISGTASDFAQVEEVKKNMENQLQNTINVDDTKKSKDGITFTMKYEKDNK